MPVRLDGDLVNDIFVDGVDQDQLFVDGQLVYQKGGLPGGSFVAVPNKLVSGATGNVDITYTPDGIITGGTLERVLPDGNRTVFLSLNTDPSVGDTNLSSPTTYTDRAVTDQVGTTRYLARPINANGTVVLEADFERGTVPVITTWSWDDFRQGVFGTSPDTVRLNWSVTGDPAPNIEFTSSAGAVHYHPGFHRSGTTRYTRIGTREDEVLTLTAMNLFGTVTGTITIPWRSEG